MLPITVIFMLLVFGKSKDCVGTVRDYLWSVMYSANRNYFPTEIELKKNFDKNEEKR